MARCGEAIRRKFVPGDFLSEVEVAVKLSLPIWRKRGNENTVTLTVLQFFIMATSIIFCGHMGKTEIDAVSLANSLINVLVIIVSLGLVEGYETLYTQAFGSENKKLMGIYLQRSLILHLLSFLVCVAILINGEGICIILGQDREISRLTGDYLIKFIPGAFGSFFYTILSRYMQDMSNAIPSVVIVVIGNLINVGSHFLFINGLGYRTEGSAYAVSVAYMSMFLLAVIYLLCSKDFTKTWPGWSAEIWRGWGKIMKLGVAALGSLSFEWLTYEVSVFLTGILGATELGAQTICLSVDAIVFYLLAGIGITGSIRVGQHLGAGDALAAKTACYTAFILIWFPAILVSTLLIVLRKEIPKIYTNVPEILELTAQILPYIGVYTLMTTVSAWANGVLRGTGRQYIAAACFFVAYYLFGLPLGITLMFFTKLRSLGFWVTLVCVLFLVSIFMIILILRTDWDQQVKKAAENVSDKVDTVSETTALLKANVSENNSSHDGVEHTNNQQNSIGNTKTFKNMNPTKHQNQYISQDDTEKMTENLREKLSKFNGFDREPIRSVILKKLVIISIILVILASGILVRLFVPLPTSDGLGNINGTHARLVDNQTLPYSFIDV